MTGWILKMLISERRAGVMRLIDDDEMAKEERWYLMDDRRRDIHRKAFQFFCLWQKTCSSTELPDEWKRQWELLPAEERQAYLTLALLLVKNESSGHSSGLRIWQRKIKKPPHTRENSKGKKKGARDDGQQKLLV